MSETNINSLIEKIKNKSGECDLSLLPQEFSAEFEITDSGVFSIDVSNGNVSVLPEKHENPDIMVKTSADTLEKIMNRELDVKMAFFTKKLSVQGDLSKAIFMLKILK